MGKPIGLLEYPRELPLAKPPAERVHDWQEFHEHADEDRIVLVDEMIGLAQRIIHGQ